MSALSSSDAGLDSKSAHDKTAAQPAVPNGVVHDGWPVGKIAEAAQTCDAQSKAHPLDNCTDADVVKVSLDPTIKVSAGRCYEFSRNQDGDTWSARLNPGYYCFNGSGKDLNSKVPNAEEQNQTTKDLQHNFAYMVDSATFFQAKSPVVWSNIHQQLTFEGTGFMHVGMRNGKELNVEFYRDSSSDAWCKGANGDMDSYMKESKLYARVDSAMSVDKAKEMLKIVLIEMPAFSSYRVDDRVAD